MKTVLNNRSLWYDGSVTVNSLDALLTYIKQGVSSNSLFIESVTDEIAQYNRLVSKKEQIISKNECDELTTDWDIPLEYQELNVKQFILEQLEKHAIMCDYSDEELKQRLTRTLTEFNVYKTYELCVVLRAVIYIINTLEENNVVWGVGRGSSVSSYILYLIGVHDVDSFKYKLNIEDFIS